MNCQNCPFAKDSKLGNNRLVCTKPEGQNTDKVVRGHWEALPECYEPFDIDPGKPCETPAITEAENDDGMPRTTASPSPAYSAVVTAQDKIITALDNNKKLRPAPEETAIENKIRAIASQMPWIGSTSPDQRAEFLDGLRDGVRKVPAKNTRETSRYQLGYQAGRDHGSIFQPDNFLAS